MSMVEWQRRNSHDHSDGIIKIVNERVVAVGCIVMRANNALVVIVTLSLQRAKSRALMYYKQFCVSVFL